MVKTSKTHSPSPAKDSSLNVVGRFIALFVFSLMVRIFFIRKGFINYSMAQAALTLDEKGGGTKSWSLELLSQIFKWFKPHYTDLTIPANLLAVLFGVVSVMFWVGAARMERRELALPCAMAFSYLPLPVIFSTSWNPVALTGLLLSVVLFCLAGAREKGAWLYYLFFGIFLVFSLTIDFLMTLLLFPLIICALKKEMAGRLLVFSVPLLLLVLIIPANRDISINLKSGYGAFLWQTSKLLVDNFSIPVLVGYLWAVYYLFITKEKMAALCSAAAIIPYFLVPMGSPMRLLLPFIAVIITLNYGILRFLENSPGYSLEQFILVTTFLTFFYFVTTPAKAVIFAQFAAERNEDRELTEQVRQVVGDGRLLVSDFFDCFSFYSHSRPFDIVRLTRDNSQIQGFEQGLLALKAGRTVAMTSGTRNILQQASVYPKADIILENKQTNIYKITDFMPSY
jgi:hypothetical protein